MEPDSFFLVLYAIGITGLFAVYFFRARMGRMGFIQLATAPIVFLAAVALAHLIRQFS